MSPQQPFKKMTWLRLLEGPSAGTVLEMAPTMRVITYAGERYFRMDKVRSLRDDDSEGGAYLWDRYWDADQAEARKQAKDAAL